MNDLLRQTIKANRSGQLAALPSVCSAHPMVLEASMGLASALGRPLIVEATSNQVNQFGGYTGMRPADFVTFVKGIAAVSNFATANLVFGGDHLGPQVWRAALAGEAMAKAETLVADYVRAGFTKIHLDCSEGCQGEPAQVDDATSANRAAKLAAICEKTAADPTKLSYMVGTEVPPPGGAHGDGETVTPTAPAAAEATLKAHFDAFDKAGIPEAKTRIVALVVQPGVEFSPTEVHHLPTGGNAALRAMLDPYPGLCFEAHSTDYQHPSAYPALAEMGFAIHKVGPALTHAYRQALYALDTARADLAPDSPHLPDVMERLMLANPAHWQSHYHGDAVVQQKLRHTGLADRIRYYWAQPDAIEAVEALMKFVDKHTTNLAPYFGAETAVRAAALQASGQPLAKAYVMAEIQQALVPYFISEGANG
ncbi:MAG: class II D-tagatose-bisphosphate aldolase, non-catalytic subunit [Rhodobacteraceae bacterium]|nr:class II D-tagatose-bisphosphate aldolase, non-catalytic subunit [Paracoccaceae bacterium]